MLKSAFGRVLAGLVAACAAVIATSAAAATTYNYTGATFTSFTNHSSCGGGQTCIDYVAGDKVTGTFTVASPLGANLSYQDVAPTSYSFTDGRKTIASSDPNSRIFLFRISTDGSGAVTDARIIIEIWRTGTSPHVAGDRFDDMQIGFHSGGDTGRMNAFCSGGGIDPGNASSNGEFCNSGPPDGGTSFGENTVAGTWAAQAGQTITFTSTAPSGAVVGGNYTPAATSDSGLTVSLSVDAASAGVCSMSGGVVSFTGAGTCVIDANQAGNTNFTAAPQVQQSFAVGQGSQTITFTSTAPSNAIYGGPTYTPTAIATSGMTVVFTIAPASSSVCAISGGVVSFIGTGSCTVNANQAGDSNFAPAPQNSQTFNVDQASQTITYTSTPPSNAVYSGAAYTPTATASSGLAVTFTIDPAASSVCAISAGMVSFTGVGSCIINADQPGNANNTAAPRVQQSFSVGQANQTVSFTSTAPSSATYGGTYTPTTMVSSGLSPVLSIAPASSGVCALSGGVVSFTGVGTCTVRADQGGNANYLAAPQATQSFSVGQASQSITFTSTAPSPGLINGATYTPTATASSGGPVAITLDPSSAGVCSMSAGVVHFNAAGTCTINANQAGNANYTAAPQAQQVIAVVQPTSVPTLGEWAMALFGLGLAGFGLAAMRRRAAI